MPCFAALSSLFFFFFVNAETKINQGSGLLFFFFFFTLHSFWLLYSSFFVSCRLPACPPHTLQVQNCWRESPLCPVPAAWSWPLWAAADTLQSVLCPWMMPYSVPLPVERCTQCQAPVLLLRCLPELEPGRWAMIFQAWEWLPPFPTPMPRREGVRGNGK